MQTILITGGSGFLGQNLALRLKNDFKVVLGSRNNKRNFNCVHRRVPHRIYIPFFFNFHRIFFLFIS